MVDACVHGGLHVAAHLDLEGFSAEVADLSAEINQGVENIGARRLHTVMEKLLEEISFTASERGGEDIIIDADYVRKQVSDLARNADVSKFIL